MPFSRATVQTLSSSSRNRTASVVAPWPRSNPRSTFATRHPSLTSPTTFCLGVLASLKNTSLKSWRLLMLIMGRHSTPCCCIGTRRKEMPLCFGASGAVRQRTKIQLAVWPLDVQTFWPLITHSSPSRTARVPRFAKSDPLFGSLYP